jgi:hypothetical protein
MFDSLRIPKQIPNVAVSNVVSSFQHLNIGLRLMPEKPRPPDPRISCGSPGRRHNDAAPSIDLKVVPNEIMPL